MLKGLLGGWADFQLNDKYCYRLSYLDNIPVEWLDQAIYGLTSGNPFVVHGFCEPDRVVCTVSNWNCYVVFEDDQNKSYMHMYSVELSMIDFCKTLYSDIHDNLVDWCRWDYSSLWHVEEDEFPDFFKEYPGVKEEFERKKRVLQEKLDCLKKAIEENEQYFESGDGFR